MRALAALIFVLVATLARPAHAHQLDLSRGEYVLDGATLRATLVFAAPDLANVQPSEVVTEIRVRGDEASCPAALDASHPVAGDGVQIDAHFDCPSKPAALAFDFDFLARMRPAHTHVATVLHRAPVAVSASSPHLDVQVGAGDASSFVSMFRTGVLHILTGYDHLAFLIALVLVGGRPRALVLVVTAFTVAHSITLALAALGVFAPSPRVVEPLVALSIAYVSIENFFVADASNRWRVTFPFGLVHGFAFASALGAIHLAPARVPFALLAFNLGVEVGQLAVLAALAAPLYFLRKSAWFRDRGVKIASATLAAAGLVLFVVRLRGS